MPPLVAPAPSVITSQIPISTEAALTLLQSYLASSLNDPSLHPDAYLTPEGPAFSNSGPNGGVVMTQLRRLEAGLRGERIKSHAEGKETLDGEDIEGGAEGGVLGGLGPEGFDEDQNMTERAEGYEDAQDADAYAREQEEDESGAEEGEEVRMGGGGQVIPGSEGKRTARDTAQNTSANGKRKAGAGAERVDGEAEGGVAVDTDVVQTAPIDKEGRKKDKKARQKEEKKERAEKRRKV